MSDFLSKKGLSSPESAGKLQKKALKNGYKPGQHFGQTISPVAYIPGFVVRGFALLAFAFGLYVIYKYG